MPPGGGPKGPSRPVGHQPHADRTARIAAARAQSSAASAWWRASSTWSPEGKRASACASFRQRNGLAGVPVRRSENEARTVASASDHDRSASAASTTGSRSGERVGTHAEATDGKSHQGDMRRFYPERRPRGTE